MTAPASAFPYPADDPESVRAISRLIGAASTELDGVHSDLARECGAIQPSWRSADGDAALAEVGHLVRVARTGSAGLQGAASALQRYAGAIDDARASIDGLRGAYGRAVAERDASLRRIDAASPHQGPTRRADCARAVRGAETHCAVTMAGLTSRASGVHAGVAGAARVAARALQEAGHDLGITARTGTGPDAVILVMAEQLPRWGGPVVAARSASAAGIVTKALQSGQVVPDELAAALRPYRMWFADPAFAAALLMDLGPAAVRDLLVSIRPDRRQHLPPPTVAENADSMGIYQLLGTGLGAASRRPGGLPQAWLAGLMHGLGDAADGRHPAAMDVLTGLGLALRYGRYGPAVPALVDPILRQIGHTGGGDDPAIGAARALSTNRPAALREVADPDLVDRLVRHDWYDGGEGVARVITTAISQRDAAAARAAATILRAAAASPLSIGPNLASALAGVSCQYIEALNRAVHPDLPAPKGYPQPALSKDVALVALYATLQNSGTAHRVLRAQLAYSAAAVHAVARGGRADPQLREVAEFTGGIIATFRKASLDQTIVRTLPQQAHLLMRQLDISLLVDVAEPLANIGVLGALHRSGDAAARVIRNSKVSTAIQIIGGGLVLPLGEKYVLNPAIEHLVGGSAERALRTATDRWAATVTSQATGMVTLARRRVRAIVRAEHLTADVGTEEDLIYAGEEQWATWYPSFAVGAAG